MESGEESRDFQETDSSKSNFFHELERERICELVSELASSIEKINVLTQNLDYICGKLEYDTGLVCDLEEAVRNLGVCLAGAVQWKEEMDKED